MVGGASALLRVPNILRRYVCAHQVLHTLPRDLPVAQLERFIRLLFSESAHQKHAAQMQRGLTRAVNVQVL